MRSGIVHHKSDRKPCVIPTADRNNLCLTLNITSQAGFCKLFVIINPSALQFLSTYERFSSQREHEPFIHLIQIISEFLMILEAIQLP